MDEFAVLGNHFVKEAEKILGYMAYVDDLIPDDRLELKARAGVSMESIAVDIQRLIPFMNEFLKEKQLDQETFGIMLLTIEKVMFSILCHLENFEVVTKEVGLTDPSDQGSFGRLKSFVMPSWEKLQLRPIPQGQDPSEELARYVATEVVKDAF